MPSSILCEPCTSKLSLITKFARGLGAVGDAADVDDAANAAAAVPAAVVVVVLMLPSVVITPAAVAVSVVEEDVVVGQLALALSIEKSPADCSKAPLVAPILSEDVFELEAFKCELG